MSDPLRTLAIAIDDALEGHVDLRVARIADALEVVLGEPEVDTVTGQPVSIWAKLTDVLTRVSRFEDAVFGESGTDFGDPGLQGWVRGHEDLHDRLHLTGGPAEATGLPRDVFGNIVHAGCQAVFEAGGRLRTGTVVYVSQDSLDLEYGDNHTARREPSEVCVQP